MTIAFLKISVLACGTTYNAGRMRWTVFVLGLVALSPGIGCEPRGPAVVVYTSVDDVFAKPIFEAFERETGVRIDAVFDAEAVKTTGLFQRLLAERARPRCDLFWSSEPSRTLALEKSGMLEPYASPNALDIPIETVPVAWTVVRSAFAVAAAFGPR